MRPEVTKPPQVFDREAEWAALASFAAATTPRALLGVISGRRRMGKTYLLRALVEQRGGFYFGATEATERESLRQFGAALAGRSVLACFSGAGFIRALEAEARRSGALLLGLADLYS